MTWSSTGELRVLPSSWDFPHVDPIDFALPEALVDTFQGAVFVNLDRTARPLLDHLENLPELFDGIDLASRYTTAHVRKTLPCNWKVALEAFIESYHVLATHPQGLLTTGDENSVYDTWPGVRHISRSITPAGVPSPRLGDSYDPAKMLDQMQRLEGGESPEIPEGETVRSVIAERRRRYYEQKYDADLSTVSDTEVLDAIWYTVFPNFVPWIGIGQPIHYLFRPNANDPETSVMDVWLLAPVPRTGDRPAAAQLHELGIEDPWSDAPELGVYKGIFAQDQANFARIQRGLKSGWKGNTLAVYQESRIRIFNHTLDEYVGEPTA